MEDPSGVEPFTGFSDLEVPSALTWSEGKVRDVFYLDDEIVLSTSDRISAFDRILGVVPFKGEILNRLSVFWFGKTEDIVANHLIAIITPRAVLARSCHVVPVEVVVRGYLTGSAWRDYQAGRPISGIELPPGMRMNERFETPLITPSTKESDGLHDRPCSRDEVLSAGVVDAEVWERIEECALALYRRGVEIAATRGLILVDTKYEFGLADGELYLIDEVHTPDSSRFWYADSYQELFDAGVKQRELDKEYLRGWLMEHGFSGEGHPPAIPREVLDEVSRRYQLAYETITGTDFRSQSTGNEAEKQKILLFIEERQDEDNEDE